MFHKSGDEEEVADLRIFLSRIMLRRTRACRLFGRAIAFPKITSKIIHVRFNDLERSIYDLISDRFIDMIQYPSEEEDADKKSSIVFTMLVRLRQSTCHVLHAIKRMTDIMTPEDILSLKRLADEHADDEHLGSQVDGLRRIGAFLECGNSAAPDFDLSCAGCGVNPAIAPWKSSCSHVYCANCVCNLQFGAPEQPQSRNCTLCGTEVIGLQPIEKEVIAAYEQKRRQTEGEQPKTSQGKHITEEPSETVCPLNSRPWLPSSKTVEIKRQIREWLSTSPEIKIVVFTHFHRV